MGIHERTNERSWASRLITGIWTTSWCAGKHTNLLNGEHKAWEFLTVGVKWLVLGIGTQTTETYRITVGYTAGTECVDNWSLL
jgi:hypothetical protein